MDGAFQILRHPGVTAASLKAVTPDLAAVDLTTLARIDIDGYILNSKKIFYKTEGKLRARKRARKNE